VALGWLVLVGLVFLLVCSAAWVHARLRHDQVELQNAVDAAAWAAVADMARDDVLTDDPELRALACQGCRKAAKRFARLNRVGGQPVQVQTNADNETTGEVVLGALASPRTREFDARPQDTLDIHSPSLNAVRLALSRRGGTATATAYADHDVIGFKVKPGARRKEGKDGEKKGADLLPPALPLVPLAVLTDPCPPEENGPDCWKTKAENSWERQVLAREGADEWRIDPETGLPAPGGDRIPEITVVLSEGTGTADNAMAVRFEIDDPFEAVLGQVEGGVTYRDLRSRDGRLLLNDGQAPQNLVLLDRQVLAEEGVEELAQSLAGILGEQRVWMVYSGVQSDDESGDQSVAVVGFVVARVMEVRAESKETPGEDGKPASRGQVTVTLQPSVMNVAAAVTDHRLRDLGPRTIFNPYIAKVRMVE
jgi:hypothetical protein